ncbi:MAG: serine/threonine protein kinase [Fibrobacter sp.]|jgi:serine/threonine protein kinase|nr:serine/threonine protein kinase [Fibrobacter sp.]
MNQNHPLQRYQIKRKISVGGMASVFLAEDRLLDREVALKMMHPHLLHRTDAIQRFSFEAKAIAALSHDNIVRIFDYGENNNRPFLVMEYIDGMNLQELLDSYGALPNLITIGIARQIVCGLICAHQKGIIHRDIKPANILLNKKGIIRITDFGIASLSNAKSLARSGSFIGSPYFISPEQATNKAVTGASDIFSLGVLLYFCLSGELPFIGNTPQSIINAIISNKPEDIRKKNPTVLLWLADLVDRCLKKNPSERPGGTEILKIIDRQCKGALLSLDCSRIVEFQKSSEEYRALEIKTLFNQYQLSASKDFCCCRIPSAIRKIEQARLLEDTQYISQKSKIRHLPFILGGITMLLSCSAIIVFFTAKPKSRNLILGKTAVSVQAQKHSPDSTIDTAKGKTDTSFLPDH